MHTRLHEQSPTFGLSFQPFHRIKLALGTSVPSNYMGKLVWKIRLLCTHGVCVHTHSCELSGAVQIHSVVCVLCWGFAPGSAGTAFAVVQELLNLFRREAAEWELVWLKRMAEKQDCPVSMEATTCVQWD